MMCIWPIGSTLLVKQQNFDKISMFLNNADTSTVTVVDASSEVDIEMDNLSQQMEMPDRSSKALASFLSVTSDYDQLEEQMGFQREIIDAYNSKSSKEFHIDDKHLELRQQTTISSVPERISHSVGNEASTLTTDHISLDRKKSINTRKWHQILRHFLPLFARSSASPPRRRATVDNGAEPFENAAKLYAAPQLANTSTSALLFNSDIFDEQYHSNPNTAPGSPSLRPTQKNFFADQLHIFGFASTPAFHQQDELQKKRRSSLELPRNLPFGSNAQLAGEASTSAPNKDRLNYYVEKMKNLKFPKTLLRRKNHDTENDKQLMKVSQSFPAVPLFSVNRDDWGRKNPPVLLQMIDLKLQLTQTENSFEIELCYGRMRWIIKRSLVDILKLHSSLTFRHLQKKIPTLPKFPSQVEYALAKAKSLAIPSQLDFMPSRVATLSRVLQQRRRAMESYLLELLRRMQGHVVPELFAFLEISTNLRDGWKGKEAYVKKGRRRVGITCRIVPIFRKRKSSWLAIRDSYITLHDSLDSEYPREVLLLDSNTKITSIHTAPLKRHRFEVETQLRNLLIQADTEKQRHEFLQDLQMVIHKSPWCVESRFNSFAPIRSNIHANFFVDAKAYFNRVYDAISSAKKTIYIQDWWLSPEVYLKRPPSKYPESRIDFLLKKMAEQGVLIFVVLYKEVSVALSIDSLYSKSVLTSLHPNIRVLRYPDHAPGGVLFWALHDKVLVVDEEISFLGGLDLCMGRYDDCNHQVGDNMAGDPNELWPGMDFSNPRIKDFINVEKYQKELIDKGAVSRLPWHDIHCELKGQAARDVARHFVQRWNFVKSMKARERDTLPYLLPPSEILADSSLSSGSVTGTCTVQLLRSVSYWSMGTTKETSIYAAYMHYISCAEHFIYIENQFFVSGTTASSKNSYFVRNRIAQALCDRIIKAHLNGQKFRVYIVMPLLPAFESDVSTTDAATTRLIVHWHQMTLIRGEFSIMETLSRMGIEWSNYITVCSLRTHGKLKNAEGTLVTEQVYVHSKMLIVDDRIAIIGSANINDRSMIGNRDSEIGVVIEDTEVVQSVMGGKPYAARKFAHELRMTVFQEHLGMGSDDVRDVLSDEFLQLWKVTALTNTLIYRDLFRVIPDDTVQTWEQYQDFSERPFKRPIGHLGTTATQAVVEESLAKVRGHLVLYPLNFLSRENLSAVFPAKESLISMDVFV